MRLHFLVEGTSEERFLRKLLPRLLPGHTCKIYPHEGKGKVPGDPLAAPVLTRRGVLDQLPAKLRAWSKTLNPTTDRVIVLVDVDHDDCAALLTELNGLRDMMSTPEYLVRLAIEEVEAWYLGDWKALRKAFPKADANAYRTYKSDSICGTWEKFQEVIADPLERKTIWAEKMGAVLGVDGRSSSDSFNRFCNGVRRVAGEGKPAGRPRSKENKPKPRRQAVSHRKKLDRTGAKPAGPSGRRAKQ